MKDHPYTPDDDDQHDRASPRAARVNVNVTQGASVSALVLTAFIALGGIGLVALAFAVAAIAMAGAGVALTLTAGLLYYRISTAPYRYRLELLRAQQQHELTLLALDLARQQANQQHQYLIATQQHLALPAPTEIEVIHAPQAQSSASYRATSADW